MTTFGPDRELTDDELDAVLAAADDELLNQVSATTTPFDLLLEIMAQEALPASDQDLAVQVLRGDSAVEVIMQRHRARLLTKAIRALGPVDALVAFHQASNIALTLNKARQAEGDPRVHTLNLANFVIQHSDERLVDANVIIRNTARLLSFNASMNALSLELDLYLTKAIAHSRRLAVALADARNHPYSRAFDLACDQAQVLENHLSRVDNLVRVLRHDLDLAQGLALARARSKATLDVSGADLSHLALGRGDLADLVGVVWTQGTRWPPDITAKLHVLSREIRPGVYQVQGGSGHDRLDLGIFS